MVVQGGDAKGGFPRQIDQSRHMGPRNQNHKAEVKDVTSTRSKTTSKVSVSQPRSKFCRIHRYDNHHTEEYPEVRATINKMVENRYRPFGRSQMGQPSQPRPTNYTYTRDKAEEQEADVIIQHRVYLNRQTREGLMNKRQQLNPLLEKSIQLLGDLTLAGRVIMHRKVI
ncbi:hypothetical protein Adt_45686 [Abeliophyllum distichum]|uniref:Uncharacterized protein n=1 Tax=Abeliophyllum distichum TaxID=126358 RepID=A0ABD1PI80_9LAMI